jgi:hypothetical protein
VAVGDDHHMPGVALLVGRLCGWTVQVLEVVAQAFFSEQPDDEFEVGLAVLRAQVASGQRVRTLGAVVIALRPTARWFGPNRS